MTPEASSVQHDPAARSARRDNAGESPVQHDPETEKVLRQIVEQWGRDGLQEPTLIENEMQKVQDDRTTEWNADSEQWSASANQAYQAGLSDLPPSGVPAGASPAQRSAYEAGREESIRKLEQELDSVSPVQAAYFGSESGLVRDKLWKQAYLSSRDSRRMDALGKVLGVQIRFAETVADGQANAKYENGVITLALNASDPVMTSVLHESVHRIREVSPESYEALSRFVQDNMSSEKIGSALNDRSRLYQTADRDVLTEEVVADAFGVILKDSAVLDQLVKDNRAAAEKALDVLRDIISSIRRTLYHRNLNLTKNQKSAFGDLESRLTEMEGNFAQSLSRAKETAGTASAGELLDKAARIIKSVVSGNKVVDFSGLPDKMKTEFKDGLKNADSDVRRVLRKMYRSADYIIGNEERSYYTGGLHGGTVTIGKNATVSTLAHELFHQLDENNKISADLLKGLKEDYIELNTINEQNWILEQKCSLYVDKCEKSIFCRTTVWILLVYFYSFANS